MRCGKEFPLSDGTPSECDPDSLNGHTCCAPSGWCGNTAAHCYCKECKDYSMKTWRNDFYCGAEYPLADGSPALCNPLENSCCSAGGFCGDSDAHCKCDGCVDYSCPSCSEVNSKDYEVIAMEYHVDKAKITPLRPTAVGGEEINNQGSSDQSVAMSISETVSETMSFSHSAGVSVTVGTEFSVGVPFLAEGKVSMEMSASYDFSYGTETSVEKSLQAEFTCVGAAKKRTVCGAVLVKDQVSIPYTMTWGLKRAKVCTCQEKGVFHEVAANRLELDVDEYELGTQKLVKRSKRNVSANTSGGIENYLV